VVEYCMWVVCRKRGLGLCAGVGGRKSGSEDPNVHSKEENVRIAVLVSGIRFRPATDRVRSLQMCQRGAKGRGNGVRLRM